MSSLRTIVPIKHRKLLRSTLVFALASTSVVCPDFSFAETSSRRTTPTQTNATRSEVRLASYAEDDSSNDREAEVIIQASCPNCQANSHSVRSAAPTIRHSQPIETQRTTTTRLLKILRRSIGWMRAWLLKQLRRQHAFARGGWLRHRHQS